MEKESSNIMEKAINHCINYINSLDPIKKDLLIDVRSNGLNNFPGEFKIMANKHPEEFKILLANFPIEIGITQRIYPTKLQEFDVFTGLVDKDTARRSGTKVDTFQPAFFVKNSIIFKDYDSSKVPTFEFAGDLVKKVSDKKMVLYYKTFLANKDRIINETVGSKKNILVETYKKEIGENLDGERIHLEVGDKQELPKELLKLIIQKK